MADAQELVVGVNIRDQRLPFMFEVVDGNSKMPITEFILPLNPESYRISRPTRAGISQTQAGAFENNIGLGLPKISLQGTFGYLGTLPGGHGKHLKGDKKDGWQLLAEFEQVFRSFYERFGTYTESGAENLNKTDPTVPPHELHFYNYTDMDYFAVQINKFDLLRGIQRRMLYQYDIQMTALRRLDKPSTSEDKLIEQLNALADLEKVEKKLSLWESALKLYTSVSTQISSIINKIQALRQKIATVVQAVKAFRQGLTDFIKAPFGLIKDSIAAVKSIIETVSSLSTLPHEFLHELRETQRALYSYSTKRHLFNDTVSSSTATSTASSAYEIATVTLPRNPAVQSLGIVEMDTPETTLFDTTNEQVSDVVVKEISIKDSDTLETIAAKELGSALEWKRIAIVNNLEYPFIVKENSLNAYSPVLGSRTLAAEASGDVLNLPGLSPKAGDILVLNKDGVLTSVAVESVTGEIVKITQPVPETFPAGTPVTRHERALSVLTSGAKIQIPGDSTNTIAVANGDDPEFYNRIYGTDEALDDDGMLYVDSSGDIAGVSGMDNLTMQLRHRLMTTRGELASLGHPEYGSYLPKIIGKIGVPLWYERAMVEAKITLLQDPRIQEVKNQVFNVVNDSIYLEADVVPINQSSPLRMAVLLN